MAQIQIHAITTNVQHTYMPNILAGVQSYSNTSYEGNNNEDYLIYYTYTTPQS